MRNAQEEHGEKSGAESARIRRAWVSLALFLILFAGLGLRMRHLGAECPWFDEIITTRHLDAPSLPAFLEDVRDFNEPVAPVYLALEYLVYHAFGGSDYVLRLFSVALGMATIVALFELTGVLFGPVAGLLAALALAVNLTHIYFSQEIRMYVLAGLLAVLSMRSFVAFLDKKRAAPLVANAVLNALLVFTHPMALLLPCAQGLHLLVFRRRPWRNTGWWIALHGLVGLSIVAWSMSRDYSRTAAQITWLQPPGIVMAPGHIWSLQTFCMFAVGTHIPLHLAWFSLLAPVAVALAFLFPALRRRGDRPETSLMGTREAVSLVLAWVVVPVGALFVLSYVWRPCFLERYLFYATFPLYIMLGALVTFPRKPFLKVLAVLPLVVIVSINALLLPETAFRRPMSVLVARLEAEAGPGDAILLAPMEGDVEFDFRHYLKRKDLPVERAAAFDELRPAIAANAAKNTGTWVVASDKAGVGDRIRKLGFACVDPFWAWAPAPRNGPDDVALQLVYVPSAVQD